MLVIWELLTEIKTIQRYVFPKFPVKLLNAGCHFASSNRVYWIYLPLLYVCRRTVGKRAYPRPAIVTAGGFGIFV